MPVSTSAQGADIYWGRVTHICVFNLTIICSDNGLSPGQCQAIFWTNAGILLTGSIGTYFSEILIEVLIFSFQKRRLKVSSAKCRPYRVGNISKGIFLKWIWCQLIKLRLNVFHGIQSTLSTLIQLMASRQFGAKPLPDPMLGHCRFDVLVFYLLRLNWVKLQWLSFTKIHLKMSSVKCLNVLSTVHGIQCVSGPLWGESTRHLWFPRKGQ